MTTASNIDARIVDTTSTEMKLAIMTEKMRTLLTAVHQSGIRITDKNHPMLRSAIRNATIALCAADRCSR